MMESCPISVSSLDEKSQKPLEVTSTESKSFATTLFRRESKYWYPNVYVFIISWHGIEEFPWLSWNNAAAAAAAAKSLQSCPTLCDPRDGSPPGSPSLGFSKQEHWSGLPLPSPMHESEKGKWSHVWLLATPWIAARCLKKTVLKRQSLANENLKEAIFNHM